MTTTPLDLNSDDTIDPNDPYIKAAKEAKIREDARRKGKRSTGGRPETTPLNYRNPSRNKKPSATIQKNNGYKVKPRTTGGRPTAVRDLKNSKQKSIEYQKIKAIKDAYINAENRVTALAEDYANGITVTNSEYQQAVANLKLAKQKYDTVVPQKVTANDKFNPLRDLSPSEKAKQNSVKATPTLPTGGVKIDWKNAFDYVDNNTIFKANNSTTPIAFIGGANGQYIGNSGTNANSALNAQSPIAFDNARSRIIQQYMNKPGGLVELKKMLNAHGLYQSPQEGAGSVSLGESYDIKFQAALTFALQTVTGFNVAAYSQNPNQSLLSFEDGVKAINLKYGGGGTASTTRRVTHQKFTADQFDVAVDQLFQQTVGRGATKDELSNVVKLLQQYEKKHPDITVTHTSANGNMTVNQRGGVDQGTVDSIMQKAALNNPNAEGYTKGSKYVGWVNDIIMDPMQLGGM